MLQCKQLSHSRSPMWSAFSGMRQYRDLDLGMEKYHQVERRMSWPQEMSPCLHSVLEEKKMRNFISLLTACFSYPDMDNSTSPLFSKSQPLRASPLPAAYKSSQAEPAPKQVQRAFLSPALPPLCSSISLVKSVWKLLWGFLLISFLGNPRTPMLVTVRTVIFTERHT